MSSLLAKPKVSFPILDLSPSGLSKCDALEKISNELYQAFHGFGFVYVNNHGISSELIDYAFYLSKTFFSLSIKEKKGSVWTGPSSNRGYIGVGKEWANPEGPIDLKEAFTIGCEFPEIECNRVSKGVNPWPPLGEDFKRIMLILYEESTRVAELLLEALAIALNLDRSFFKIHHTHKEHSLRLLHYPPIEQTPQPGQMRIGEHSDYGSLTLLFQRQEGGLEVLSNENKWVEAPYIPGTVLVNAGDLMKIWSGGIFRSAKHRIQIPIGESANRPRYSMAFFCQPNFLTEVFDQHCTDIDSCKTVLAGEYLANCLRRTHSQ
jgi:isopenicillin N synthase-like dioxygenase